MRYFIIGDSPVILHPFLLLVSDEDEVHYFHWGKRATSGGRVPLEFRNVKVHHASRLPSCSPAVRDRAVVFLATAKARIGAISRLRKLAPHMPVLVAGIFSAREESALRETCGDDPNVELVNGAGFFLSSAGLKWRMLELRRKVIRMKNAVDPAKPLWVLTQDDPDPDAIASALALRELLGFNARSAPLVSRKPVSRNENISMIRLLGVKVRVASRTELLRAPQIAMVDVQPGFFPFWLPNVRIAIDHHPPAGKFTVPFMDIRAGYGATSTILTEYLQAERIKISPRLATALYYALKTDTLLFGRGVSHEDFNAFTLLWPIANHQMVSQMERPRMRPPEVATFLRALKGHTFERGCLFADLGRILKDDIVPRVADFVLQIGEPRFALVWGVIGKNITFAARSLDPACDAGEVMRIAFGHLGSAGGHRSMARATAPLAALRDDFGRADTGGLTRFIKRRIVKIVLRATAKG